MSHRLEKLNELIKQVLGRIILENEDFEPGILVTIMGVETSIDAQHAKVIVSVYPTQKAEQVFEKLNSQIFNLQQLLNKKLEMRPVPKIRFILDKTAAEVEKINKVF